jgi:nitroreductase
METLHAIRTRRSVRHFTDQPVSAETITELLQAAMFAPSAANRQPWHFIVLNERTLLDEVPNVHPYAQMLKQAQAAILVCGDAVLAKGADYWVQDCAAATQNILLAAHALGLGGVWLGVHPNPDRIAAIRSLFSLPPDVHPLSLVALGYPAEPLPQVERFNPQRVHYNRW